MSHQVVCVSRTLGAGGEDIARAVAARLGFRYVDDEIVLAAAEKEGVDIELIKDAERRQSLVARLLESIGQAPVPESLALTTGFIHPAAFATGLELSGDLTPSSTQHYRDLIRAVVRETAEQGRVVIVAHAAAMALAGMGNVLRVFITASPETRAARLAGSGQMSEAEAAKAVKSSDKDRRDYFKRFYQVREELPTHYDLVINTDALTGEKAASLVVAAVQS